MFEPGIEIVQRRT